MDQNMKMASSICLQKGGTTVCFMFALNLCLNYFYKSRITKKEGILKCIIFLIFQLVLLCRVAIPYYKINKSEKTKIGKIF